MQGAPKYPPGFAHIDYVNPDAPTGGVLRLNALGTFDTLNPYIIKGAAPRVEQYNVYVFEALMYRSADEPFSLYPWLAESLSVNTERSKATFTLNPKARWQDGKPVTADDILFTVETLKTKGRPAHRAYYGKVDKVEKLGERTVAFTFKKLADGSYDRELPLIISLMPILPKHYWADKDFTQTTLEPPLGSGAYKVASIVPGRKIMLERVPDYWAADLPVMRGLQNFDTITIDYFRDDTIAREALLAGALDLRFESDPLKMRQAYQGAAIDSGAVELVTVSHRRPEPYKGIVFNTRRPLFANKALRQALSIAADFDALNKTLFGGIYKRSLSSFPNSVLALPDTADETLTRRERLQKAKHILTQAGYTYKDGRLMTPDGQPVQFQILLGDAADERLVTSWREAIRPLGADIDVRTVDSAQFQARLNDYDYDAMVFRWINSLSPGNEQRIYWGSAAADTPGTRNYAGVKDPKIDAVLNTFLTATDYQQVIDAAHTLDRQLIEGAYVIPFFHLGADLVARSKHIRCPANPPMTGFELRSCWYD
ncbi:MAG: extracellular solute-binding protein, partial [Bdellovibrionales bacterium]